MQSLLGFSTGRYSKLFGTKFLHCPGTKGQWDKLKILPRAGTGRDSQNLEQDGPAQAKSNLSWDVLWKRYSEATKLVNDGIGIAPIFPSSVHSIFDKSLV